MHCLRHNLGYLVKSTNCLQIINRFSFVFTTTTERVRMEKISENIKLPDRLSQLIRPVHYKLVLLPNLTAGVFQGDVKINVCLKVESKYIALHTKFLNISNVEVYKNGDIIPVSKYLEMKELEQLVINFDDVLDLGLYEISIGFNGTLTRNIVGLYSSHLKNSW